MIIGNGMMASRFSADYSKNNDVLIFASGVSNSSEKNKAAFEREENLLKQSMDKYAYKTIVYFSTCSIFDPSLAQSPYILHKLKMEELIKISVSRYLICRTSNIVGKKGNPNTLINFLIDKIEKQEEFELWANAFRNILDIDDLFTGVHTLLIDPMTNHSTIANSYYPLSYSIGKIITTIENHLQKKANYKVVEKGSYYPIPATIDLNRFYPDAAIQFREDYLSKLLNKYHPVYYIV